MVTDFMVRLSIRWSLLTSHLRGIEDVIIVASREPKKAPLLEVRVMYEPSRIFASAVKIALNLGYEQYARHVAVRLKREAPSNPPLQRT